MPAYRTVTREQASARWLNGVPEHEKAALIPPGVFDAWVKATWATDAEGAQQDPPVIRAPNGVMADVAATWWVGKPYYDPAKIAVPVLLVTAAWDSDVPPTMARALLPLFVNRAEQTPDRASARHAQRDDGNAPLRAVRRGAKVFG